MLISPEDVGDSHVWRVMSHKWPLTFRFLFRITYQCTNFTTELIHNTSKQGWSSHEDFFLSNDTLRATNRIEHKNLTIDFACEEIWRVDYLIEHEDTSNKKDKDETKPFVANITWKKRKSQYNEPALIALSCPLITHMSVDYTHPSYDWKLRCLHTEHY